MNPKKLFVIGHTWPEPKATAAGRRMEQLLRFFLECDYEITFSSTARKSEYSLDLEALGIATAPIALNDSAFDTFISQLRPDVVLFDRFLTEEQFGWRVAEYAPDALRILDTEDLHSLRYAREEAFRTKVDCTTEYWLQTDTCKRELASILRSDLSLIISNFEWRLLTKTVGLSDALLTYLPFLNDPPCNAEYEDLPSYGERSDFICIGNGKHRPNTDAVIWLKETLWPLIRQQLPKANLHIYGAYLPEHIYAFHNETEGFLVHGWVDELRPVMEKTRVNLAPLRFGAGLKGKLLDAMRYGTPSITTPVGAEGIHQAAESANIASDPVNFAQKAVTLYRDKERWHNEQHRAFQVLGTLFDGERHRMDLQNRITELQTDLGSHRIQNVTGRILLHQTAAATKYMAKWIEEKNRQSPG